MFNSRCHFFSFQCWCGACKGCTLLQAIEQVCLADEHCTGHEGLIKRQQQKLHLAIALALGANLVLDEAVEVVAVAL